MKMHPYSIAISSQLFRKKACIPDKMILLVTILFFEIKIQCEGVEDFIYNSPMN